NGMQVVELGRRKQSQRVPAIAPGVTYARVSVENGEWQVLAAQVIADCESGLAATDDDRFDVFGLLHAAKCRLGSNCCHRAKHASRARPRNGYFCLAALRPQRARRHMPSRLRATRAPAC